MKMHKKYSIGRWEKSNNCYYLFSSASQISAGNAPQ